MKRPFYWQEIKKKKIKQFPLVQDKGWGLLTCCTNNLKSFERIVLGTTLMHSIAEEKNKTKQKKPKTHKTTNC